MSVVKRCFHIFCTTFMATSWFGVPNLFVSSSLHLFRNRRRRQHCRVAECKLWSHTVGLCILTLLPTTGSPCWTFSSRAPAPILSMDEDTQDQTDEMVCPRSDGHLMCEHRTLETFTFYLANSDSLVPQMNFSNSLRMNAGLLAV